MTTPGMSEAEKIDVTLVSEIIRRLKRIGSKGTPSQHGYCRHCGQNEKYNHNEVVEVISAIADHAGEVTHPEWYGGVYVSTPAP